MTTACAAATSPSTTTPPSGTACGCSSAGSTLATGYDGEMIGTTIDGRTEYLQLKQGALTITGGPGKSLTARCTIRDGGGATWTLRRRFTPRPSGGIIDIETTISVDRDREVVLLPWLTILPGHGSFGAGKHQGLFAGVEYLADEPSSSKADLDRPRPPPPCAGPAEDHLPADGHRARRSLPRPDLGQVRTARRRV